MQKYFCVAEISHRWKHWDHQDSFYLSTKFKVGKDKSQKRKCKRKNQFKKLPNLFDIQDCFHKKPHLKLINSTVLFSVTSLEKFVACCFYCTLDCRSILVWFKKKIIVNNSLRIVSFRYETLRNKKKINSFEAQGCEIAVLAFGNTPNCLKL